MNDSHEMGAVREFRFEGVGLAVAIGVLVAVLAGTFYLGRWYERSSRPATVAPADDSGALSHVVDARDPVDTDRSADFFDAAEGGEKEAEPGRQAQKSVPPPVATQGPAETVEDAGETASAGSHFVQVFAGRDRTAAERLVAQLKRDGYPVRVFSQREGQGSLFKVRVGGYPDDDRARAAQAELVARGYSGAWVTRIE